jgi:hypothetical protein
MPDRLERHELSLMDRLARSLSEVVRDQVDIFFMRHALIDSYWKFRNAGEPYPFVQKKQLKPRARTKGKEFTSQNAFLALFYEGSIAQEHKKYIRFFDDNRVTKENVREIADIELSTRYTKNLRYFDHPAFGNLLVDLLSVDYALLIQRDPTVKRRNRFILSHFHVKIDWPIDDAAEDMARQLCYISKSLYESGDKYAHTLRQKLFEKYGFHHTVGGRRTAGVVAAQFLNRMDHIFAVYVASSESRALTRIDERGVTRFVLIELSAEDMEKLSAENDMMRDDFEKRFLVDKQDDCGVCVFRVVYRNTRFSTPPEGKGLRRLKPDYQWLTVGDEHLIPLAEHRLARPLRYRTIYGPD